MPPDMLHTQALFARWLLAKSLSKDMLGGLLSRPDRIAVHRNNNMMSLIGVLEAHFPVTRRIVGDEFFQWLAREFIGQHKPLSPVLITYGAELPAFIARFAPAEELPYLADIAQLEFAWISAYHSAEHDATELAVLNGMTLESLMAAQLVLHPSLRLLGSSYPVASIWQAHQPGHAPDEIAAWAPEQIMILRPAGDVVVSRIEPDAMAFLSALQDGRSVATAGSQALVASPTFDLGPTLMQLLASGAIVKIIEPSEDLITRCEAGA